MVHVLADVVDEVRESDRSSSPRSDLANAGIVQRFGQRPRLDRAAKRSGLRSLPQGFRRSVLERAYAEAFSAGIEVTDESAAVERMGGTVAVVPGDPLNRKLTTPEDLAWAELHLAQGVRS